MLRQKKKMYAWAPHFAKVFSDCGLLFLGDYPKKMDERKIEKNRPLEGTLEINSTLYIWQPVTFLKANLFWTVVLTIPNQGVRWSFYQEVYVIFFIYWESLFSCVKKPQLMVMDW